MSSVLNAGQAPVLGEVRWGKERTNVADEGCIGSDLALTPVIRTPEGASISGEATASSDGVVRHSSGATGAKSEARPAVSGGEISTKGPSIIGRLSRDGGLSSGGLGQGFTV